MRPIPLGALLLLGAICAPACGGDSDTKKDTSTPTTTTTDASSSETDDTASDTTEPDVVVPTGLTLPAGARGCEILVRGGVSDVTFAAGVKGTFIREAPLVAISVVKDGDFANGDVSVVGTGTIVTGRCVDAAGAFITGEVTFQ